MSCKKVVFLIFTLFFSLIGFTYGTNYSVYHNSTDGLISFVSGDQTYLTIQDHFVGQSCNYEQYQAGLCTEDELLGCFYQVHNNHCFKKSELVGTNYNFVYGGIWNGDFIGEDGDCPGKYPITFNKNTLFSNNVSPFANSYIPSDCSTVLSSTKDYTGFYNQIKQYSPWANITGSIYGLSPCGTGFFIIGYTTGLYNPSYLTALPNSFAQNYLFHPLKGYISSNSSFSSFKYTTASTFWSSSYIINQNNYLYYTKTISLSSALFLHYIPNALGSYYSSLTYSSWTNSNLYPILCQSLSPVSPSGNNWVLLGSFCYGSDCGSSAGSSSYTVNYNNGQTQSFTTDQSITINGYSLYNGNGSFSPYINVSYTDQDNQVLTESYDKTNLILGGKFNKTYTGGESNFWVLSAISQGSIPDIIYTGLEFTGSSNISGNIFTNFVDNSFDVIGTNIPNFISYGFVLIVLIILIRLIRHFKKGGKGRI